MSLDEIMKAAQEAHTDMLDAIDNCVKGLEEGTHPSIPTLVHRLEDAKAKWARLNVEAGKAFAEQQEAIRGFHRPSPIDG